MRGTRQARPATPGARRRTSPSSRSRHGRCAPCGPEISALTPRCAPSSGWPAGSARATPPAPPSTGPLCGSRASSRRWGTTCAASALPSGWRLVGRAGRRRHVGQRDRDPTRVRPAPPAPGAGRPPRHRAPGAGRRGQRFRSRGGPRGRRRHQGAPHPAAGRAGRLRSRGAAWPHRCRPPLRLPGVRRLARPGRTSRCRGMLSLDRVGVGTVVPVSSAGPSGDRSVASCWPQPSRRACPPTPRSTAPATTGSSSWPACRASGSAARPTPPTTARPTCRHRQPGPAGPQRAPRAGLAALISARDPTRRCGCARHGGSLPPRAPRRGAG